MSIKANVIANYAGQAVRGLASIAFLPLYIKYLGMEKYGLIAVFAVLQSWLAILDVGMTPVVGREMARFTAGAHDARSIRVLLRSIELLVALLATVLTLCVFGASHWLASEWLNASGLSIDEVATALALMGVVAGLRLVEDVYISALAGLQLQVKSNFIIAGSALLRAIGALAVLVWIAPTVQVFFVWQVVVSLITVAALRRVVHQALPGGVPAGTPSLSAFRPIWRFAAGMTAIAGLSLLLTQFDKILLSKLLPLEFFAQYALASAVAGALFLLVAPIATAFYPLFTELVTTDNQDALADSYHRAAQFVTVLVGAAAIVMMIFGERVLAVWLGDSTLAAEIGPLLSILALGTLLNALNWIPYQAQLAHGWTSQGIKVNAVAVLILVPATMWAVPRYGAMGAAWVWVTLNSGYLIFAIYFMHLRILRTEKWKWYRDDIALPILACTATALLARVAAPRSENRMTEFIILAAIGIVVVFGGSIGASSIRAQVMRYALGKAGFSR